MNPVILAGFPSEFYAAGIKICFVAGFPFEFHAAGAGSLECPSPGFHTFRKTRNNVILKLCFSSILRPGDISHIEIFNLK